MSEKGDTFVAKFLQNFQNWYEAEDKRYQARVDAGCTSRFCRPDIGLHADGCPNAKEDVGEDLKPVERIPEGKADPTE